MANNSLALTSLDFDTLKQNFINYMSTQSALQDYNFQGSNINVLLDVMSYNTFQNAFYLNMVFSEMFMDSAQNYDSVVSHAKELNYLPQSAKSATTFVSFPLQTTGLSGTLVIPQGTRFSGTNSNGSYIYTTSATTAYFSSTGTYNVANLQIFEGSYFSETFVITANLVQSFVLSNKNIDISSINIVTTENGANTPFVAATTLFGLNSHSNVFFVQAAQNNKYEIVFGDNLFGRIPAVGAIVNVMYRITSGSDGSGITTFYAADDIGALNNATATTPTITVLTPSYGGSNQESIESVRFNAPRYFATQQRAVSSDDYRSLVLTNFSGDVADVSVYGGETLVPKQYGRVVLSVLPTGGSIASDYLKNQISNFLLDYISIPNRVIISDPDYFYTSINTTVTYNKNITKIVPTVLSSMVANTITSYSSTYLGDFNSNLRYSKLVAAIDAIDPSIISNDTVTGMIKRISPVYNISTSYTINFNNPINYEAAWATMYPFSDQPSIISSSFTYVDSYGKATPNAYIRDNNKGILVVYVYLNNIFTILNSNIGTVNYTTGQVQINSLMTSFYNNYISVYAVLENTDIIVGQNQVLEIDINDVNITINVS